MDNLLNNDDELLILTKLPPECHVCPVNLSGSEVLILSLLEVPGLKVALPQVLVDVVAQRALDLLAPLARGEHGALRDLDEHLPRRRLLVLHHQLEARVVEVQQPGLLRLARLNLDLRRDDISDWFRFPVTVTCSLSESASLLDSLRAQIFNIFNE